MKRIAIISTTFIAALLLGACTKVIDKSEPIKIPVEVSTMPLSKYNEEEAETRAGRGPMTSWLNTQVYMAYGEAASDNPTLFQDFKWAINGLVSAGGKTSFQPELFYPETDALFLRGFHPRECINNPQAPTTIIPNNEILYTITGQEDIMISNIVSGTAAWTIKDKELANPGDGYLQYEHLLSMLSFVMKSKSDYLPHTIMVKSIKVNRAKINATLNLDPAVDYNSALTFDNTEGTLVAFYNEDGVRPTAAGLAETGYVMLCPGDPFELEVEFVTPTGYSVTVTDIKNVAGVDISAGNTVRGNHYTITLTFDFIGINPNVTSEWTISEIGSETGWW